MALFVSLFFSSSHFLWVLQREKKNGDFSSLKNLLSCIVLPYSIHRKVNQLNELYFVFRYEQNIAGVYLIDKSIIRDR